MMGSSHCPGLLPNRLQQLPALLLALCFWPPAGLLAENLPNWDRTAALQAAALQANPQQLSGWMQQIDAGQADQVLAELRNSSQAGSPAFEQQLFLLAQSMAEAPLDNGSSRLLSWLQDYSPEVRVAHEESAAFGVPLFPVAAAAQGSIAERQRRAAELQTASLIVNPRHWIDAYSAASPVERQGLERGLSAASAENQQAIAEVLAKTLANEPALARPAGIIAGNLSNTELFLSAFRHSRGADSVQLLREAGWRLGADERSRLFHVIAGDLATTSSASQSDPVSGRNKTPTATQKAAQKTALAISILAPGLQGDSGVGERLLQLLDDPQLGAAAALALAGHPDVAVQAGLQQKLRGSGLAAQRAALALGEVPANALQTRSRSEQE